VQPMTEPPNTYAIQRLVALARETLASLRDEHGQVIDSDAELLAALADEGVGIDTVLSHLGRAALDAAADVAAADARINALSARYDRHARRESALRAALLQAMGAVGLKSYKDAEFTAAVRYGQARVQITDPDALPAGLVTETVTRKPHRVAIRDALEAGKTIPGATLDNGPPVLTIRNK
jgi:hypothetical protein